MAAEVLRVAIVGGLPQRETVATLGKMLQDFTESCDLVARFAGTGDPAGIYELSGHCSGQISKVLPGKALLLPLGWCAAAIEALPLEATIVLATLRRRRDQPCLFDLAIVTGGGVGGAGGDRTAIARYHPLRVEPANADLWSRAALVLLCVPQEKLHDGGIWFVLYRLLVCPHASLCVES